MIHKVLEECVAKEIIDRDQLNSILDVNFAQSKRLHSYLLECLATILATAGVLSLNAIDQLFQHGAIISLMASLLLMVMCYLCSFKSRQIGLRLVGAISAAQSVLTALELSGSIFDEWFIVGIFAGATVFLTLVRFQSSPLLGYVSAMSLICAVGSFLDLLPSERVLGIGYLFVSVCVLLRDVNVKRVGGARSMSRAAMTCALASYTMFSVTSDVPIGIKVCGWIAIILLGVYRDRIDKSSILVGKALFLGGGIGAVITLVAWASYYIEVSRYAPFGLIVLAIGFAALSNMATRNK